MPITFTKDSMSVVIPRGRIFPTQTNVHVNQVIELAESGAPQVTELGGDVTEYEVELLSVDATTEAAFRAFWQDPTIRWALTPVTLTDERGQAMVGRYWGPFPTYQRAEYASGLFRLAFLFREET